MTNEVAEADLVPFEEPPPPQVGLFNTTDPDLVIARAVKAADALKKVVVAKKLVLRISGRDYILAEGWTTLGAMVGVFPRVQSTGKLEDGWEAAVEVVNSQGLVIGRAEAECLRSERNWKNRDDFALRSMAQTRAMAKALRMPLGFIAVLAGYEATPAEEMPTEPEDIPFEASPAQGPPTSRTDSPGEVGTGGAPPAQQAHDSEVAELLELADKLGGDAPEKTAKALADQRSQHGFVRAGWIGAHLKMARALVADAETAVHPDQEEMFPIPEAARKHRDDG